MNDELRARTNDLNVVNAFLDSILTSLQSGVAVLDLELRVLAWNAAAEELWGIRSDEAEGQHFLNLDIGLPVSRLSTPLREALAGRENGEVVLEATNRRGRNVTCHVQIRPMQQRGSDGGGLIVLMEAHERDG